MRQIKRDFTTMLEQRLRGPLNFIQVVLGPRQVGKTTGLQQIVSGWRGPSLMVSADEVAVPRGDWLAVQWERARRLGENALFVVDEVQKIPDWSGTVKYLFDQDRAARRMKVVLLGSASLTLQRGLADSLAGRFEVIMARHWGLSECREAFGWSLAEFMKFGGYPAAAELAADVGRWQAFIRDAIVEPVLVKDILGLSTVGKPALFRQTFELAMSYPAQEVSLQKLLGQLQDRGNVTTVKHYLELLEGAYLLRSLPKYSGSAVRRRGSSPKILPLNTALVHAFRPPAAVDQDPEWAGRILETVVGAALAAGRDRLYYWRQGRDEVDFVVETQGELFAVEVKSGRRKGLKGLARFLDLHPRAVPVLIGRENVTRLLEAPEVSPDLLHGLAGG